MGVAKGTCNTHLLFYTNKEIKYKERFIIKKSKKSRKNDIFVRILLQIGIRGSYFVFPGIRYCQDDATD